jgi:hypothetical protein
MTVAQTLPPRLRARDLPRVSVVWIVAVSVVALRLPLLDRAATPDEGGFLVVASQWHVGGSSLYGDYWVDRPPLLIGIFRFADLAGGLVALRLIGALAAAATVAVLASTADRAWGRRAAAPTAVVAAALLITPLFGSEVVNGELLAAPFVALGLRMAVEAVQTDDPLVARGAALATGLVAMLALMVKQNMADVVVFALVCWVVAWRTRRLKGRTCSDLLALAAVGGAVGYAVVMLWAMAHGTSPLAVYEATYPFRLHADEVIAATPNPMTGIRLDRLSASLLLSGAPLVLAAFGALAVRRTRQAPVVWALLAAGAYAAVSIMSGGSYWLHYLVQAVPVVALAAGAVATVPWNRTVLLTRVLVSVVVVSAVTTLVAVLATPTPAPGATVGRALAVAARPGDTVLSAFGDADILETTGMSSPYPYLWSLPSRTLDPDMTLLRGVLSGPRAPTWIVTRGSVTLGRLRTHGVAAMVESRYRVVARLCGRTVYLLDGVVRPALRARGRCGGLVLP